MSGQDPTVETWDPVLLALADNLRDLGYDIEPSQLGEGPVRDIVARRDLEDRAVMLAVDASGPVPRRDHLGRRRMAKPGRRSRGFRCASSTRCRVP